MDGNYAIKRGGGGGVQHLIENSSLKFHSTFTEYLPKDYLFFTFAL